MLLCSGTGDCPAATQGYRKDLHPKLHCICSSRPLSRQWYHQDGRAAPQYSASGPIVYPPSVRSQNPAAPTNMSYSNYSIVPVPTSRQPASQYPDSGAAVCPLSTRASYPTNPVYDAIVPYGAELLAQFPQQPQPEPPQATAPPPATQQTYYSAPPAEPVNSDDRAGR